MGSLLLALLAGSFSALAFEPVGFWPAVPFAVAVLLALVARAPSLKSALARGWWFGVGQFALGLNWIATAFTFQAAMPAWLGWVAVVLLSLFLAIYPAIAAGLAWRWGRGKPLVFVLLFAAAWIVTEWMRAELFTGFAWNPLAVALLPAGLAAPARWVGTYGLSGLAVLFAGAFYLLARRPSRPVEAGLLLVAVLGSAAAASMLSARTPAGEGPSVRVVQPNIGQDLKWSPGFAARNLARLAELSALPPAPGTGRPGILIWPEAAVTEPLVDARDEIPAFQAEVAATRAQVRAAMAGADLLLTGGITVQSEDGIQASGATNSVFAIDPTGRLLARYDKAHLVPYGEYLPMRPLLSAIGLSRLAPGELGFDPGPGPRTLALPIAGEVGFQLCYEIIFSGEVIDPENRPDFVLNPSNDAWFGAWGPPQHLAQARLRALEEGVPVVRATPTGVSAVIDSRGAVVHRIGMHEVGVIDARLPQPAPPTLFARWGNPLPFGFALLLVAAAALAHRRSIAAGRVRR